MMNFGRSVPNTARNNESCREDTVKTGEMAVTQLTHCGNDL